MIRQLETPFTDEMCFFCGKENEAGLQLTFFHDDEANETFADYVPEQRFQGQGAIFHGGMQMGLLDEAMWWAGYAVTGVMEAVTTNASFRFLRPVLIDRPLRVICSVAAREGDTIRLRGRIVNESGKTCTAVKGEYRIVSREKYESLIAQAR